LRFADLSLLSREAGQEMLCGAVLQEVLCWTETPGSALQIGSLQVPISGKGKEQRQILYTSKIAISKVMEISSNEICP
jgi:hypothetical protein